MIELVEKTKINNPKNRFQLLIDKKIVSAKVRNFEREGQLYINLYATGINSTQTISNYKFADFPNLYYLTMPLDILDKKYLNRIYIIYNDSTGKFEIKFRYQFDSQNWKNKNKYMRFYSSYSRFITELNYKESKVAKKFRKNNLKPQFGSLRHKTFGFEIMFTILEFQDSLNIEIHKLSNILHSYHREVLEIIETLDVFQQDIENFRIIKSIFNFPKELKVHCKQYLEYFAQFLQDLGINATSNLKEEAGKILFAVTPTDDVEALDKIREALAVYLNLPSGPIIYDESFAAMRLQQQVENLQHSQRMAVREIRTSERELRLAQTVIGNQDKTIQQKDSTIEQQNKIIEMISSKTIMMDSVENKEELEEIYDGLKIGESEFLKKQLGIHLNPAKVIKTAVKNTFGKDEKKSVLGLDEKD